MFARFKAKESVEAVEQLLSSKVELQYFERSQLGMQPSLIRKDEVAPVLILLTGGLCCETAEEAKMLIPSLANKITDADLQELLDDITRMRVADQ